MDLVREVVAVAVRAQVRYELVEVVRTSAEGAARRQVNVTNNLVDTDAAGDVAALGGLLLELFCPPFLDTLRAVG